VTNQIHCTDRLEVGADDETVFDGFAGAGDGSSGCRGDELRDFGGAVRAQKGSFAADIKYRAWEAGPRERDPLAVVEIDHTLLDIIVVDINGIVLGRPTLTIVVCRATRMVIGFCLTWEAPNYTAVMLSLRHAIAEKPDMVNLFGGKVECQFEPHGVPITVIIDNALEFYSASFKTACAALGIAWVVYCQRRRPQWKGRVKRYLRTLGSNVLHNMPGSTKSTFDRTSERKPADYARIEMSNLNRPGFAGGCLV
jgi:putative transposase